MTSTPEQVPIPGPVTAEPSPYVEAHADLDERLDAAFRRYDEAFREPEAAREVDLPKARLDLSLLLWEADGTIPAPVLEQMAVDAHRLVQDTPPL